MNGNLLRKMKILITSLIFTLCIISTCAKSLSQVRHREEHSGNIGESKTSKRVVTSDPNRRWDDAVIPYEISSNFSDNFKKKILQAMDIWESKACIKFVPAEPIHKFRVIFTNVGACGGRYSSGCCSTPGKIFEKQNITLNEDVCSNIFTILHEMAHTMGFYHEQSRPDRDKFIKVFYENINKGAEGQYTKLSTDEADTLGFSYDFNSIMHYTSYGFAIAGKESMQALNKSISLKVKNKKLSETDIAVANIMYKCPDCYVKLSKKVDTIDMSANSLTSPKGSCQWFIKRDPGEFIQFYIQNVDILESNECSSDYLQFQDGYSPKSPVIDRVCGRKQEKTFYKTGTNNLLITYKSSTNSETGEFLLKYRVICNGTIKGDYGMLQNPNYDKPYPYDSVCQWVLMVPIGYRVALTFDSFDINAEENCLSDYIEVIDGEVDSGNVILNKVCGKKLPDLILSTNNILTVTYVSEKRNVNNKFSASFVKEINECELPDRGGCNDICINTIGSYRCECSKGHIWVNSTNNCEKLINSCGGTIQKNERVVIASPFYPDPYPSNIECTWNILEDNLNLSIYNVDINGSEDNCLDQIIVQTDQSKKVVCGSAGTLSKNFRVESNLKIRFISKQNTNRSGFEILITPL